MSAATDDAILHKLGGIEAKVENAERSRAIIHQKMDAQADALNETVIRLQEVGFALKVTTDVAVQARDRFEAFEREFREDSQPLISGAAAFRAEAEPVLRAMKTVRNIIVLLAGLGVLSVGGLAYAAVNFGEAVKLAVRWYLGIA